MMGGYGSKAEKKVEVNKHEETERLPRQDKVNQELFVESSAAQERPRMQRGYV